MNIKIEIKAKGKEIIPTSLIEEIMGLMDSKGYKNGSIKFYRICDVCGVKLPENYPIDSDLCPNCEVGKHDADQEKD